MASSTSSWRSAAAATRASTWRSGCRIDFCRVLRRERARLRRWALFLDGWDTLATHAKRRLTLRLNRVFSTCPKLRQQEIPASSPTAPDGNGHATHRQGLRELLRA